MAGSIAREMCSHNSHAVFLGSTPVLHFRHMKIVITGHKGYIGSALRAQLSSRHEVIGFDLKDGYDIKTRDLPPCDAVIHLAGFSKEPTGAYSPRDVDLTNHIATARLAQQAKTHGARFILGSSTSVYFTYDSPKVPEYMTERHQVNPISAYSLSKRAAEEALEELADDQFQPVILRKGTVYGYAPQVREDLSVQKMADCAVNQKQVTIIGDVYRPMLDIQDAIRAYEQALALAGGIYNAITANWRIADLGERIADYFGADVHYVEGGVDRNYRADGSKLGLEPTRTFNDALYELRNSWQRLAG